MKKPITQFEADMELLAEQKQRALGRDLTGPEELGLRADVFAEWLDQKRYDELTSVIASHYRSAVTYEHLEDLVRELAFELRCARDAERLHALFEVAVAASIKKLRFEAKHAATGMLGNTVNLLIARGELGFILLEYYKAALALKRDGLKAELDSEIRALARGEIISGRFKSKNA